MIKPLLVTALAMASLPLQAQQQVMLDVTVRDRRGRPVTDLQPGDFEVFDGGVKQSIQSVRRVEGKEAARESDALRQVRLVTLLFGRLEPDARRLARQAATDLVRTEQPQTVLYAVLALDQQLSALQPFTPDRELVKKAIDKATSGAYTQFAAESAAVKKELQQAPKVNSLASRLAEVMLGMLEFSESVSREESLFIQGGSREQSGRPAIFGLQSVVRGQQVLPGRKTVLYFSEGLRIPINLGEQFDAVIGTANRGNVSIYTVDAGGLNTSAENRSAIDELRSAAATSRTQAQQESGPVSPSEMKVQDAAEESLRANPRIALSRLAEETGGFLIANTNDMRTPLRRMSEDIAAWYEIAYTPAVANFDGRFRKTSVRVLREDARVQARSGYFALPPVAGGMRAALLPHEAVLMNALASLPLPRDLEFRSAALRFERTRDSMTGAVVVEVELKDLTFTQDQARRTYRARLSLLALIKNAKGEVVHKFGRDLPLQGGTDKLAALQAGRFIYKERFTLPPGRYTLEAAVIDRESGKIGARRASLMASARPAGVGLSNVALVRRFEPKAKDLDAEDPFQFQGGRVTPTLSPAVPAGKNTLSFFFVVYPDPAIPDKPQLALEYLQDGKVVGRGAPELPAADARGRIPFVMSSSAEAMKPGAYEIRAVVRQGASAAEERAFVTIEP